MESRILKRILLASSLIAFALVSIDMSGQKDEMPVTTSSPKAKALLLEATDIYFEKGDQVKCTEFLKKALEIDPNFAVANTWYAYMGIGSVEQEKYLAVAMSQVDKVSVPEMHFIRSYTAYAKRNFDEAISEMKAAIQAAPGDKYLPLYLSEILGSIGRYSEALEFAKLSSEKDPGFAYPVNYQGFLLRNLEKPDESEKAYLKAIEINPGNPEFLNNYAQLLRSQNRLDEAINLHKKALSIREDYLSNLFLGHCYIAKEQYPEARNQYLKARAASSTNGQKGGCLDYIAYTYLYEGNLPGALAAFDNLADFVRQAGGIDGGVLEADINKAYSCILYGEYEKYAGFLQDVKNHMETLDLSESDKALMAKYIHIVEGYLYAYKGDIEKTRLYLDRFEKGLSETDREIYKYDLMEIKGLIEYHEGNYPAAIASLEQASAMGNYYAGLAYEKLGNKDKAKETYMKIIDNRLTSFDLAATKPFAKKRLAQL